MRCTSKRIIGILAAVSAVALVAAAPVSAQDATAEQIKSLKAASFDIPGSVGIKMIRIREGKFSMGSPAAESGRYQDEAQHEVTISKPFYMAETETTQAQYIPAMIPNYKPFFTLAAAYGNSLPELDQGGPFNTVSTKVQDSSKYPMEGVVWDKAVEFCSKMTERESAAGRLPQGYVYRLPTEAEWEYACRAGSTGPFNSEGDVATFAAGPNLDMTRLVKEGRKPNAWGLYDTHGNVYEWCADWYGSYGSGSATDPAGPTAGEKKVARGGCYISGKPTETGAQPDPRCLRSAYRGKFLPDFPLPIVGFRVVLGPEIASK